MKDVTTHKTHIKNLGFCHLPDPAHGDLKLSVMPFQHTEDIKLPEGFKMWEKSLNDIMRRIPIQIGATTHYVTIDTKFFTTDEFLHREGVHIDGNFCVDPEFGRGGKESWGGIGIDEDDDDKETWGGMKLNSIKEMPDNSHVKMDWVLPYDIVVPVAKYVSEDKGGLITVSNEVGCKAWIGQFDGEVLSQGAYDNMLDQLTEDKEVILEKNHIYFMTSNTPHETLLQKKGTRRTFMRITLNHNYNNKAICQK